MKVANLFSDPAQLLAFVGGVLIPFLVALLARPAASGNAKALLSFLSAGLLALGLYLTEVTGAKSWQGALSVFIIALITAAASRVSLTGHQVDAVQAGTPGVVG